MMIKNSLKSVKLVDRVSYLQDICREKKVLHLGATDSPLTKQAIYNNCFLHSQIDKVSKYLIGLDLDMSMIDWLAAEHNITNIKYGNIEKIDDYPKNDFDIIIAGEILEHLSNAGAALDCIQSIMNSSTQLVVTVPNAYSIKGLLRSISKYELIHQDHTLHHSPYTLKNLLERHGFSVDSYFSYINGGKGCLAKIANFFIHANPQVAEGIGVVCKLKHIE